MSLTSEGIKHNAVCQVVNTARVLKALLAIRLWTFLVGMTMSFTVGVWWCRYMVPPLSERHLCEQLKHLKWSRSQTVEQELRTKQLVFIGIMTSQKFLTTRAKGVYDTWGENVPGKLIFFAGAGETLPVKVDFPVLYLPVPDNVHPPQRKSLAMLRYIYDNYIDHFQWFIRADDDVYIRTAELSVFLRKFNSSEPLLLGQAGIGKPEERGKLGLRNGDNFCMGGPGVIMSRGVLKKVTPHLKFCSNNTSTSHEDTEVGRCLRNFAGVMCPWAFEAKELFHQVYENQDQAYHDSLSSPIINKALTLHPIKDPAYMRRLHVHYLSLKLQSLDNDAWILKHKLQNLKQATTSEFLNSSLRSNVDFFGDVLRNSTTAWETFYSRQIFSLFEKAPLRWIHDSVRGGLVNVVRKAKRLVQVNGASQLYHSLRFTTHILGYLNFHPVLGLQYIISVSTVNTAKRTKIDTPQRSTTKHLFKFQQPFMPLLYRQIPRHHQSTVHFIVPLAGRLKNFRRFLASFENAFLRRNRKVKLLVVYFPKLKDPRKHVEVLHMYKKKYTADMFHWLNVNTNTFNRGLALNLGSKYFGKNALLSFTDVDLVFRTEYVYRCRENTKRGKQVYFPIMFSQFHPNISRIISKKTFTFHKDNGLWRIYSYGPVCIYSDDVSAVSGFNTTIKGWGLEDVEFFEKFVKRGKLDVIRAPDDGIVHVYHKHAPCSPKSTFQQQKMCHDAKAAYLSSASSALDYLFKKRYLNKNTYL